MAGEKVMRCAECGCEIPVGEYCYVVGDNFIQLKYFDSASDNCFCSQDCLCRALSVVEIENKGDSASGAVDAEDSE